MPAATFNFFVNVEDAAIPDVAVTTPALDLRCAPHVVNLTLPAADPAELWEPPYGAEDAVLSRFYEVFGDDYDFANVVFLNPACARTAITSGSATTFSASASRSSTIRAPTPAPGACAASRAFRSRRSSTWERGGAQHELGHQWDQHSWAPVPQLGTGSPHWPPSDNGPAAVDGIQHPGHERRRQLSLVPHAGTASAPSPSSSAPAQKTYTALDLYLMGLVDAADVPPFAVMDPPDQPLVKRDDRDGRDHDRRGQSRGRRRAAGARRERVTQELHDGLGRWSRAPGLSRTARWRSSTTSRLVAKPRRRLLPYAEGLSHGTDGHPFAHGHGRTRQPGHFGVLSQARGRGADPTVSDLALQGVPPDGPVSAARTCSAGSTC
jgi:hypothetical protein